MGSFKKLKSSDVITVPVVANKSWNFNYCPVPTDDPYVSYYNGINSTDLFNPDGDYITNGQYDRLTYRQINQLFYHDFSGSLNTSSLASSLYYESASSSHPTASYFNFNNDPAFISNFPTGANAEIKVIQISPKAYGSRLLPYTFQMSSSAYNFYDDGKGNIYDNFNSNPPAHVGNIFYEQGTIVITNQDFQTLFILPPVAYDDTYTIIRSDYPNPATFSFNPLLNDDLRGNTLVNQSITLFGGDISFFNTGSSNTVSMSFSGLGIGTYQTFYTFLVTGSYCAPLRSGTGSIVVNVIDPECEFEIGIVELPAPSPSPTPTISVTPTTTATPTPTISVSRTPSVTPSVSPTPSISISVTPSVTPSITPSMTPSISISATPSITPSVTPSISITPSTSISATPSVTPSVTPTISVTPSTSISATPSVTPSVTPTISVTPSITPSTSSPLNVRTVTSCCDSRKEGMLIADAFIGSVVTSTTGECFLVTSSPEFFTSVTWSGVETPSTYGADCNACQTSNPCPTPSVTPSTSISATPSVTPSVTPTISVTPSTSISATPSVTPSVTPTISVTPSTSISATPSVTPSVTPSISISATPSVTPSISISVTPSITPSASPSVVLYPNSYYFGSSASNACGGFLENFYCMDTDFDLCNATVVFDSDGANCYLTQPAATYISDGLNSRYWNGTAFGGACVVCGGCLVENTVITMADGSTKLIQDIQIGDEVKSLTVEGMPQDANDWYSWISSEFNSSESTATVNNITTIEASRVYNINDGLLVSTNTHNHVVKHEGNWYIKTTANLVVGDILLDKDGNEIEITSLIEVDQSQTVYNIDVTNSNLYFANNILTHNK